MTYMELFPSLVDKKHIQTIPPPPVPETLLYWYKADQFCAYHHGAPRHDLEDCYGLKSDVQRLIKRRIMSFIDVNPNVQVNILPQHGGDSINMVEGCPGTFTVYDVCYLEGDLVEMHLKLGELIYMMPHNYEACGLCRTTLCGCRIFNVPEPLEITFDSHNSAKSPLVIYLPGPAPYQSDKVVPYKYQATMIRDGKEVPLPFIPFVINIADLSGVTRSGRVFTTVPPRNVEALVGKKMQVEESTVSNKPNVMEESSRANINSEFDEVLRLIKKSEYKTVDQLLQTPSKISILSLLMSYEAHREALQKVLEQAYFDHDVTIGQFDSIVANITACNNLSFSHEELPVEGKDHNMALHISMNCLTDSLSGVFVDTSSSLNVMPKLTLSRLNFQGAPMRSSGVIVQAFDDSRKTIIGEVDLPMTIGPHTFQITFQFQTLSIADKNIQENGASIRFFNDARQLVEDGSTSGWGQVVSLPKNKFCEGLGFSTTPSKFDQQDTVVRLIQETFQSGGFINPTQSETNVVIEEDPKEDAQSFVTHGIVCRN
ncbi:uncharacterized protein LOC127131882 [Lathyrus oleraceus]|uniref:uncharacterized protein LOC127131882 n=1 Tax=Pisum sativum TaxID=3888 RepID=UPI0021CF9CA6|nr:uncharacterized protein LOC127131882 [Pisum sativum]